MKVPLRVSPKGLDLIKHFESFQAKPYFCSAGKLTIGYGHTGKRAKGPPITLSEAQSLLLIDLAPIEAAINGMVIPQLRQYQFDALAAFVFNVGIEAFRTSTLLKVLNAGYFDQVDDQLLRWNKITDPATKQKRPEAGLTRRRMCEALVWNEIPLPADMLQGVNWRQMSAIPANPDETWFRKLINAL